MNSFIRGKTWVILLALVALIGLVLLASGLSSIKFDPPDKVGIENLLNLSNRADSNEIPTASWVRYFVLGMFVILFLLMMGPVRPQTSRNLIVSLLRFSAIAFVLMLVMSRLARENPLLFNEEESTTAAGASGTPEPFSAPEVSMQWEFWITAAIVIVVGVFAIVAFNRLVDRLFQSNKGLEDMADIARSTLSDLSSTKESKNVIIRCYTRMTSEVNKYRGITRDAAMTPAEFAGQLESAGLPREDVRGLTQVFERVRYGGQTVSPEEIKEARNCLTGILKACEARK